MPDKIFEEIRSFEEYLAGRQTELRQLEEQHDAIERTRAQYSREVEIDNSNADARRELEKAETGTAELKKKIANHSRWTRSRVQNLRTKILQTQESELAELHHAIETRQTSVNELRTALIPTAEQHLSELREHVNQLEDEMKQMHKSIDRINKLNLDVLFAE